MAVEIERKFLVKDDSWKAHVVSNYHIIQGYLVGEPKLAVRLRIIDDKEALLTIKGKGEGIARPEYEYPIPLEDAKGMLLMCGTRVLEKKRHLINANDGLKWEVDVFAGRHAGLVLAEIELPSLDTNVELPEWAGEDVSEDPRYLNAVLAFTS